MTKRFESLFDSARPVGKKCISRARGYSGVQGCLHVVTEHFEESVARRVFGSLPHKNKQMSQDHTRRLEISKLRPSILIARM